MFQDDCVSIGFLEELAREEREAEDRRRQAAQRAAEERVDELSREVLQLVIDGHERTRAEVR